MFRFAEPRRCLATALGALPLLAVCLVAQEPTPTFRSGVELVTLDVSVLDKTRHQVKGLTAADFTVLEDGKPQPVVTFDAINLPDAVTPSAPWMRDVAPDVVSNQHEARRIVVILMDDSHTSERDMIQATTARLIGHEVIDRLGEDDLAAVTFTDIGRWQNLTSDRTQLKAAVDSFNPHPESPFLNAMQSRYRTEREAFGGTSSADPPPTCVYAGASHGPGACVIEAFKSVAEGLASAPQGRKTIVYIGDGVPYESSTVTSAAWRVPGQEVVELQALLRSLQQANVNVYTLSLAGAEAGIFGPQQDWMRVMAEQTGGHATIGTNTPEVGVPQIFVENSSYYMLGFRPGNRTPDGKFRRIEVRVKRPGVETHTRSGYYAPLSVKPTTRDAQDVAAPAKVDRALEHALPGGTLPVSMTVAPVGVPGSADAALAITVALVERLPPGRHRVELATTAVAYSCPDCPRQTHRDTIEFVPKPDEAAPETYEILSRLAVKPGRYNVRVGATLGDRSATVFTDVDVPNFATAPLSASGLVISVAPPAVTAQRRLLADVLPLVPSAIRVFTPSMSPTAFVRLTQGGTKPTRAVSVTATICNADDHVDVQHTTTLDAGSFDAGRSADFRFPLPVGTLGPGPHLLTITMALGDTILRRDARFTIE